MVGYGVFSIKPVLQYSPVLAIAVVICALFVVCPRSSGVPLQAAKQAVVIVVANFVLLNVIPERTVPLSVGMTPCSILRGVCVCRQDNPVIVTRAATQSRSVLRS
jgi:hypothetical protein